MTQVITNLPLFSESDYSYSISLEGQSFKFNFRWIARASQWIMNIYFEDGTPLLLGYALVAQYPMGVDYVLTRVVDTAGLVGLTGYFVLLSDNATNLHRMTERDTVPQKYKLYYIVDANETNPITEFA